MHMLKNYGRIMIYKTKFLEEHFNPIVKPKRILAIGSGILCYGCISIFEKMGNHI